MPCPCCDSSTLAPKRSSPSCSLGELGDRGRPAVNDKAGMLPRKNATQEGWISSQSRPPVGGWKVAVATCLCLMLLVGVNVRLFSRCGGAPGGVVAKQTHLSSSATPLFPKIIWTYWNDDDPRTVPKLVKLCAWTWQLLHPGWQFHWLTPATTAAYVGKFSAYQKAADSPARLADFVRLAVIAEHGGVWTDASILPLNRLDQWLTYPLEDDEDEADVLAAAASVNGDPKKLRQRPMTTTTSRTKTATNASATTRIIAPTTLFQLRSWNKLGPRYPLIESWFFAAPPHAPLMVAWKKQLDRLLDESVTDFLQENRDHGVDFQGLQVPEYLAIHVAVQRAIQDRPLLMYGVAVHDAEVGPYRHLATVHGWDPDRFCREYFVPALNLKQQRQEKHWSSLDDALENTIILTRPEDKAAADAWIGSFTFDKRDLFIKLRSRERYPCEQLWNEAVSSSSSPQPGS